MGNQLAASSSVSIADVSSTLELVAPLAGARRCCYTTLHCTRRVPLSCVDAATAARCACADAFAQRRRRHRTRVRDARARSHSSNSGGAAAGDDAVVTATTTAQHVRAAVTHGGDAFAFTGALQDKHSSYVHVLLMPPPSRARVAQTSTPPSRGSPRRVVTTATPAAVTATGAATPRQQGQQLQPLLYCSAYAAATSSPSSTTTTMSSAMSADGGAQATTRVGVVVKMFARSVDDVRQAAYVQRVHALLCGVGEQLAAVDATRTRGACVRAVVYYDVIDARDARCVLLQRPYMATTLPARLAAQPRWRGAERRFVCYQLLQAVSQLHDVYGVVHGDIKPSNVCVHSSGALCLVDVAPHKPAWLPANNPVLYHCYYDTSSSGSGSSSNDDDDGSSDGCCCIAPEKFVDSMPPPTATTAAAALSSSTTTLAGVGDGAMTSEYDARNVNVLAHTTAMDMFAMGCVLAQVLTGEPLLRLADVLTLRTLPTAAARCAYVQRRLLRPRGQRHDGEDSGAVPACALPLLLALLCELPAQRPSARAALALGASTSFFAPCLAPLYTSVLPSLLCRTADVQAHMLCAQLDALVAHCSSSSSSSSDNNNNSSSSKACTTSFVVRVLWPLLQHALRYAATDEATYRAAVCMQRMLRYCDMDTQLHVVLPRALVVVNKVADTDAHTRLVALRVVCAIATRAARTLRQATLPSLSPTAAHTTDMQLCDDDDEEGGADDDDGATTRHEVLRLCASLFDELVLPCLGELLRCADVVATCVLVEVASQLPRMLLLARFCLVRRQLLPWRLHDVHTYGNNNKGDNTDGDESVAVVQLHHLLDSGWDMLQLLYRCDRAAVVATVLRRTAHVAAFLGEERTQYDLLPLLTTVVMTAAGDTAQVQRVLFARAVALHAVLLRQHEQQELHLQPPQQHAARVAAPLRMLRFFVDEGVRPQRTRACVRRTLDAFAHVLRSTPAARDASDSNNDNDDNVDKGSSDDAMSVTTPTTMTWQARKMAVVHQVLPCLLSPHATVRAAASDVVAAAATRSFAPRDVLTHLACVLRPLLTRAVPLSCLPQYAADDERSILRHDLLLAHDSSSSSSSRCSRRDQREEKHASRVNVLPCAPTTTTSSALQRCARRLTRLPALHTATATRLSLSQLRTLAALPCAHVNASDASSSSSSPDMAALWHVVLRDVVYDTTAWCSRADKHGDATRMTAYTPTPREARRAAALMRSLRRPSAYNVTDDADECRRHVATTAAAAAVVRRRADPLAVPRSTRRAHHGAIYDVCVLHANSSNDTVDDDESEDKAMSSSLHSKDNAMYCHNNNNSSSSSSSSALLLSCGAHDEALLWCVDAARGLQLRQRAPRSCGGGGCCCCDTDSATKTMCTLHAHTYTTALPLYNNSSAHVALGSTRGVVSLLDVRHNVFVAAFAPPPPRRTADDTDDVTAAAAVTSLRWLRRDVLLVARADGHLDACDVRVGARGVCAGDRASSSVWHTTLHARDGAPSCVVPLYDGDDCSGSDACAYSSAYAMAVCTDVGVVCLYDTRFRCCVQRYCIDACGDGADGAAAAAAARRRAQSSCALRAACVDVSQPASRCARDGVSLLLAASRGSVCGGGSVVYRLQLRSGVVAPLLQLPPCNSSGGGGNNAVRAMLTQPSPDACVYTGSEDGYIRRWSLSSLRQQQQQQESMRQTTATAAAAPSPPRRVVSYGHTLTAPPHASPLYVCADARAMAYDARCDKDECDNDDDSGNNNEGSSVPLSQPMYCIREAQSNVVTSAAYSGVPRHHDDAVTALALVPSYTTTMTTSAAATTRAAAQQAMLVSAARDGTLTLWCNATS